MKLGILSDTHNLLRPEVCERLAGADAILHAGDICRPGILEQLRTIAPVYAVAGNNDRNWAEPLPPVRTVELDGLRICMTHIKKDLPRDWNSYDLVVVGHTHRYAEARQGKTLVLNPGSCGHRLFHQPITFALAETAPLRVTKVELASQPPRQAPGDIRSTVELVVRETEKGRSPREIARRFRVDAAQAEQIARLYVTHPGVSVDGILRKMGL